MGIFTERIGSMSAITGFAGGVLLLLLVNAFTNASSILFGFPEPAPSCLFGYLASFVLGRSR